MSINDSEIEDAISHLGEIETDEDVTTDTGDSDDSEETVDSSTSTSSSLEIVRSYANNSTNTDKEMGGNCMVCYVDLDIFNIVNMEGALIGASMAIEEVDMELSQEEKVLCKPKLAHAICMKNTPWMRGYNMGYDRGIDLIHKQQDRVYDVLEVTRGPNLFDYGFTKEKLKKSSQDNKFILLEAKNYIEKINKKVRLRKRNRESKSSEDDETVQPNLTLEVVAEEVV